MQHRPPGNWSTTHYAQWVRIHISTSMGSAKKSIALIAHRTCHGTLFHSRLKAALLRIAAFFSFVICFLESFFFR